LIHLYAIVDGLREPPPMRGIGAAPLELRTVDELGVVVSVGAGRAEETEYAVLRHATVVEAVAAAADALLPSRFGDEFPDDSTLRRSLLARYEELRRRLDHVRGCVEIGVRALGTECGTRLAASGGTAYMTTRLRAVTEQERLASELQGPLRRYARDSSAARGARTFVHDAAYLVPRPAADVFVDAVAKFQARHPELSVLCTGPWPPYSFAQPTGGDA
jgi:hypothetical protein